MCTKNELLIENFKKGDVDAMSVIVDTYKNDLYNLCFRLTFNKYEADDLLQQTWIKVMRNAHKYEDNAFKAWLYTICINQYKDQYRKQKRRNKILRDNFKSTSAKDYILMGKSSDYSLEEDVEKRYIQSLLVTNILKLNNKYKLPIVLHYYQKIKYAEIAQIMGIPEGTIKSRINTAKKILRKEMESELYV